MTEYSANLCVGGIVTASSSASGRLPARAFNGTNTDWNLDSWELTGMGWITYEFTEAKVITQIILSKPPDISPYIYMPSDFAIQGSINGIDNWQSIISYTGLTQDIYETAGDPKPAKDVAFEFNNTTAYKAIRLNLTGSMFGALNFLIGEIQMMETLIVPPVNPYIRPDNIKGLYNITKKAGIRNAAKNGFVRPTLAEMFKTDKDFVKIPRITTKMIGGIETEITEGEFTYKVHTFLNSDSLEVVSTTEVEYLVIGGGAGGGYNDHWAVGGAGGGLQQGTKSLTIGNYPIIVGTGGAGRPIGSMAVGGNGTASSAFGLVAGGGYWTGINSGASGSPQNIAWSIGRPGISSSITGTAYKYCADGGWGNGYPGSPDCGGHGSTPSSNGMPGLPNTGGGGGGGSENNAKAGGDGGSGIVVIRYKI